MGRTIKHMVTISTSEKGIKFWDATVEVTTLDEGRIRDIEEYTTTFVFALSDRLAQELDKRYPPAGEMKTHT